jgi:hypothetical protein
MAVGTLILWSLVWLQNVFCSKEKVAIINTCRFHHELYPAFHYAWKYAGYEVHTYVEHTAANQKMDKVTQSWGFDFRVLPVERLFRQLSNYNTIILTSAEWERDLLAEMKRNYDETKQIARNTKVILVYHQCIDCKKSRGILTDEFFWFLTLFPNATVLGLAKHSANSTAHAISSVGISKRVDYFIPLFPLDFGFSATHTGFALQGKIDNRIPRRDYSSVLAGMLDVKPPYEANLTLKILGHHAKDIKRFESEIIRVFDSVPYPSFYGIIRKSLGLLTAFAKKMYLTDKSSSTVAASLICKTPLVTERATLDSYTFLSPGSIWQKEEGEKDIDAMKRIIRLPDLNEQFMARYASLVNDIDRAYKQNDALVRRIMV